MNAKTIIIIIAAALAVIGIYWFWKRSQEKKYAGEGGGNRSGLQTAEELEVLGYSPDEISQIMDSEAYKNGERY